MKHVPEGLGSFLAWLADGPKRCPRLYGAMAPPPKESPTTPPTTDKPKPVAEERAARREIDSKSKAAGEEIEAAEIVGDDQEENE